MILDVLRYAIDFDFRLMDGDVRVCARYAVDFSLFHLFLEEGAFSHANADACLLAANVRQGRLHAFPLFLDHEIELDVHYSPSNLISIISLRFLLDQLRLFPPTLFAFLLKLLDICQRATATSPSILLHIFKSLF